MTEKEKAELLAAGEKCLLFFERAMEKSIRDKALDLARMYRYQYSGAAYMLEALGLLSYEEYDALYKAIWARYLETAFPQTIPMEAVKP